jgi:hypothetical protein
MIQNVSVDNDVTSRPNLCCLHSSQQIMKEQQRKEHDKQCKKLLQIEAESTDRMKKKIYATRKECQQAMRQLANGEEYGCVLISKYSFHLQHSLILRSVTARQEQMQSFVDEFNRSNEEIVAKTKAFRKEKKVRGVVHAAKRAYGDPYLVLRAALPRADRSTESRNSANF